MLIFDKPIIQWNLFYHFPHSFLISHVSMLDISLGDREIWWSPWDQAIWTSSSIFMCVYVPWIHSRYLSLGLDLSNFDHRFHSEVLTVLLVHLAVHPDHGIVHLLARPSDLQLIQVTVLLILFGRSAGKLWRLYGDWYTINKVNESCCSNISPHVLSVPGYLCLVSFNDLHVHLDLSAELLKCFWPLLSFHVSLMNWLAKFLWKGT